MNPEITDEELKKFLAEIDAVQANLMEQTERMNEGLMQLNKIIAEMERPS